MAINVNRATILGRLGADPEQKGQQGDFVSMQVATSTYWRDKQTGERQERTQWHTVVIFVEAKANFIMEHAKKGDLVYVEGAIETRKWEKNPGETVYFTEIVIRPYNGEVQLMSQNSSRIQDQVEERQQKKEERRVPNFSRDIDDEIPF
jgi:single-strand DNA-binding protein